MEITITDEELESILITAGEHGCGYWARTKVPLTEAMKRPVQVFDAERPAQLLGTLTRDGIQQAGTRLAELTRAGKVAARILSALVADPGAMDAEEADVFVQVALFGEVRFG